MSITRNLLIIDDEYVEDAVVTMAEQLKNDGYIINHFSINPKSQLYENKDTFQIDLEAVLKAIKKCIGTHNIHIIACDYTLGDDIDGIMILSKIKTQLRFKGTHLLFSTKIDKILGDILSSNLSFDKKKDKLKKLIRSNSIDFPSRKELYEVLKDIIKNTKFEEVNIRHELLKWLHAFKDHPLKGHPDFESKSLGKIAQAIEDETSLGIQFQQLFVEQAISVMIQLNQLPPNE